MDLELALYKGLDYSRRRKKLLLLLAAFGISGYGVYRVYNLPAVVKKRKKFTKLIGSIISLMEVISDSTETLGVVCKDLKEFLQSDSDELPTSLKQISKIARSNEFSDSLVAVTQAFTIGVLKGYNQNSQDCPGSTSSSSFSDQVLDKLFTSAGTGFASVVVGNFARSLVLAIYAGYQQSGVKENNELEMGLIPNWVNVISSDKCKEMIADCIQVFVSSAVAVYLDKTMDINTYDDIFSGLTNPKHGTKVRDVLVSVCNGAVETLVKTSHQVMTNANSSSNGGLASKPTVSTSDSSSSSFWVVDSGEVPVDFGSEGLSTELKTKGLFDGGKDNGWVNKVSSTLAVPRNRNFVLDVTGRVTFETVRSFLDFLLRRMLDGLKRSFRVVREEVVERGLEVFRYVTAKSAAIVTICFAFCLHVVSGSRILMPA